MCPETAKARCDDLTPVLDPTVGGLIKKTGEIAGLYGVCKFKQEVLVECLAEYEK